MRCFREDEVHDLARADDDYNKDAEIKCGETMKVVEWQIKNHRFMKTIWRMRFITWNGFSRNIDDVYGRNI